MGRGVGGGREGKGGRKFYLGGGIDRMYSSGGRGGGFGLVYWGLTPQQQPGSYQGWAGGRKGKSGRKFYLGGRN